MSYHEDFKLKDVQSILESIAKSGPFGSNSPFGPATGSTNRTNPQYVNGRKNVVSSYIQRYASEVEGIETSVRGRVDRLLKILDNASWTLAYAEISNNKLKGKFGRELDIAQTFVNTPNEAYINNIERLADLAESARVSINASKGDQLIALENARAAIWDRIVNNIKREL